MNKSLVAPDRRFRLAPWIGLAVATVGLVAGHGSMLIAVPAVVVMFAASVWVAYRWPFALVVLTIWTSVMPVAYVFHLGSFGIAPYEILEGLALAGCALRWLRGELTIVAPAGVWFLVIFMGLTTASALLAVDARGAVTLLGRFWLSWLVVFLVCTVVTDRRRFGWFVACLVAQAAVLITISIASDLWRFGLPSLPAVLLAQVQKNEYATYLAFAIAVSLVAYNTDFGHSEVPRIAAVVPVVAMISWPLTYSRSGLVAIVGTLVLMPVLVQTRRMTRQALAIAGTGVLVWIMLPSQVREVSGRAIESMASAMHSFGQNQEAANDENSDPFAKTIDERLVLNLAALHVILAHPLTGLGLTRWQAQSPVRTSVWDVKQRRALKVGAMVHNRYLLIAAESGLPTLLAYGGFLAILLTSAYRARLHVESDVAFLLTALVACTASLLVAMLTMPGTLWEWNQLAVLAAAERLARREVNAATARATHAA